MTLIEISTKSTKFLKIFFIMPIIVIRIKEIKRKLQ
jgi:hypothetical protein